MKIEEMIEGCGKPVEGSGGFVCGDSVESGTYVDDMEVVFPIYCTECCKGIKNE